MQIIRCDVDKSCASYEELKARHVVAQGWSSSGDLSFLVEDDVSQYISAICQECRYQDEGTLSRVLNVLKGVQPGVVFVATEGMEIKGICEIPPKFSYVYDGDYEYANAVFPVEWVDWSAFCSSMTQMNRSPGPMLNVHNDVARYISSNWNGYKEEHCIDVQPTGCASRLNEILALRPKKIEESRKRYTDIKERMMNKPLIDTIVANLNVILTGAPGTGKTWTAKAIATELAGSEDRVKVVQFHPGYDYSDFVMGLKPVLLDWTGREIEGAGEEAEVSVSYRWKPGVFKKFADAATADPAYYYVLVIDEINRADLSRVFGELFSLIEKDYRGESKITLPNGEPFSVPANLYIIGTMNDIDRSVDSIDFALRRRFAWYEVTAESSERIIDAKMAERNADAERIKKSMRILNHYIGGDEKLKVGEREIALGLGAEYQLGGAIFANAVKYRRDEDWPAMLWENHIKVILSEYLRGNRERTAILDALKAEYDKAID